MKSIVLLRNIIQNQSVKNGFIFSFFSFLNSGIGFLLLIILANYVNPDGYGKLNLFTTSITLVSFFICLSTTSFFTVSFFRKSKEMIHEIVNIIILITLLVSSVLLIIVGLFGDEIAKLSGINTNILFYVIIISATTVFFTLQMEVLRTQEKPIHYGLFSVLNVGTNFVLTLILIIWFKCGWEGRAYSQLAVSILMGIIGVSFLYRNKYLVINLPNKAVLKETLVYALPLIPHLLSGWLRSGADRYIINFYYDSTSVGLYGFAASISSIINIAGTAFNATNSVFIFKKLSQVNTKNCRKTLHKQTILMIGVFTILSLTILICSYIFIPLVFPKYIGSVQYIFPCIMASLFYCVYLLYVNYLFYFNHTTSLMYITFTLSIIQVSVSLLITQYNIIYTAYLSMIISALATIMVYIVQKKIMKKQFILLIK